MKYAGYIIASVIALACIFLAVLGHPNADTQSALVGFAGICVGYVVKRPVQAGIKKLRKR